jgi:hypothetical protein
MGKKGVMKRGFLLRRCRMSFHLLEGFGRTCEVGGYQGHQALQHHDEVLILYSFLSRWTWRSRDGRLESRDMILGRGRIWLSRGNVRHRSKRTLNLLDKVDIQRIKLGQVLGNLRGHSKVF